MDGRIARVAAWLGGAFFVLTGAWAFAAPRSFFDTVATYPPYNEHLFHDLGAFALGVAAALVAGALRVPGLATGLLGGAVAATLHALAHWLDRDLGGRASDPPLLTLLAAVVLLGAVVAMRRARGGTP